MNSPEQSPGDPSTGAGAHTSTTESTPPPGGILSQGVFFAALGRHEFQSVLGAVEQRWLDFKEAPYRLDDEAEKVELCKDVCGMANGGGGVLCLGFGTRKSATGSRDVASRVRSIAKNAVNAQQYADVVISNTYPPIRDLTVLFWPETRGADSGAWTIQVPAAGNDEPVLVVRSSRTEPAGGILIGAFHRYDDRVLGLLASEIHADLQLGRAMRMAGSGPPASSQVGGGGPDLAARERRSKDDARMSQLSGHRRYILQAWPASAVHLPVQAGDRKSRDLLKNSPQVRNVGFNLTLGSAPTALPSGGWTSVTEHRCLSLERSGLLTWTASADQNFLAHAAERRNEKRSINPIALVESTLLFAELFVDSVLPTLEPRSSRFWISAGMEDLNEDGEWSVLCAGTFHDEWSHVLRGDWKRPSAARFDAGPIRFDEQNAGRVAFAILAEIYNHFDLGPEAIPYSVDGMVVRDRLPR